MVPYDQQYEQSAALATELRRGVLVLVVLSACRTLQYGYSLKQELGDAGMDVSEGTIYPLLRRLESQGLLESEWQVVDDQRPRRYYRLSGTGQEALAALERDWVELTATIARLGIGKESPQ